MNRRKPDAHEAHHAEHARHHVIRQAAAEYRHRQHPDREHQHPQQQRAFVAAPHAGDAVLQRQRRVRIRRDVQHREIVGDESVGEAAEGDRDEHELALRRRTRQRHPGAHCRAPRRRGAARPARARDTSASASANCPSSGIIGCAFFGRGLHALRAPFLHRVGRFGRHVVLVVLGEHLARDEHAVGPELALRHDALALAEEVGQDAAIDDRHALRGVGDDELHRDAVGLALDAALLDQPADAEGAALRRFVRRDLRGREEEHQVLLERVQHERRRDAERRDAGGDQRKTLMPRLHWLAHLRPRMAAQARQNALFLRRRPARPRATISPSVTPYEPQT